MISPAAFATETRALFTIAWPMIIAQLAQMGTGVVDTVMAGHYSAADLAAIAIGYNIWLPLFLLFIGMMLGATVIIAQDYGAGRVKRIRESLPQALWLALILGSVAGPLCYFAEPLLNLLALGRETHGKSLDYLQAVAFGLPATALFQALRCHTQGIGIMRPFAIASIIGFLANIPLNYMLIYGRWGAPELGAAGCGWATTISMWLSPLLITFYMARSPQLRDYLPPLKLVAPDFGRMREITRVGLPMGLTFFMEIGVFSVIALLVATLGNTAMASHQIAFNVWDVVYMPLISIGSAMATRIGHAIGRGDRPGVKLAIFCGSTITFLVGISSVALLLTAPGLVISAYTEDADIHAMAVMLVNLVGLFIVIDTAQVAGSFCLRAFKDTRFPFIVSCIAYWLIALPVGYWMGIASGASPLEGTLGFWKGMILGIGVSTLLVLWRLRIILRRPLSDGASEQPPEVVRVGQS
jgi:MATE family multidrug resistance protein